MVKRIAAIVFIFGCTAAAWMILGATIFARTQDSDSTLKGRVASTWGTAQRQAAPTATTERLVPKQIETTESGRTVVRTVEERETRELPLEASRINVDLQLEHRRKGLLWYATYAVTYAGTYRFRNTTSEDSVTFTLPFPASRAIYDNLTFTVNGTPLPTKSGAQGTSAVVRLAPGESAALAVGYRSQGLGDWRYEFGNDVAQVRDFALDVTTNFKDIDFADNTLSPSTKTETPNGWKLGWRYDNLVSGYQIGVVMPEKLQPGPLAGRISFFAPVSLFFFFFLMFIITTVRGIELHPMNYFFLAAAFFAFHLLLAYLVDHVDIHAAFVIASVVSVFLVVSYLRLVVGTQFAVREAALAQLLFLVLFSYAFFFEGYTGLAITIGSIITLFIVMQMTGRIRWAEKFARVPA